MSKLEKLIQQYCPDGVEWKMFYDICDLIRGITYNKSQEAKTETEDAHKVLRANNITLYLNVLNFEDVKLVSKDVVVKPEQHLYAGDILMCAGSGSKEHVGKVAFISENIDYTFGGFMAVVRCKAGILPRYMFHILSSHYFSSHLDVQINSSTINNINKQVMQSFAFPVPPLPVQEEIVRVLDAFTELQAELQAELQKRLQQYEYYKWNIFEGLSCPTKHITDVALVKARVGWQRLTTAEYQETGDYYLITGTDFKNGKIDFNSCVFVSKERYEMDPNIIVGKGDILITKDGTLGKVAFMAEEPNKPTTLNSGVFRIHTTDPQVSSRYLFHYFTSKYFTDFVNSVKTGSTIPHLTQQGLVSLNIPIPSLEEQNRVVSILDKFEALTNDLTAGLPAEMEKRRQQYEFYRDKLLTFKRKEA